MVAQQKYGRTQWSNLPKLTKQTKNSICKVIKAVLSSNIESSMKKMKCIIINLRETFRSTARYKQVTEKVDMSASYFNTVSIKTSVSYTYFHPGALHNHFGELQVVVHREDGVEIPKLETKSAFSQLECHIDLILWNFISLEHHI